MSDATKSEPERSHRLWDNYRIICTQELAAQTELVAAARAMWTELDEAMTWLELDYSDRYPPEELRAAKARLLAALEPFAAVEV